ncbi:MAG: tetraacyldisaccharide 4'-kinase, partial [Thermodesulfobacteriota bacterium]
MNGSLPSGAWETEKSVASLINHFRGLGGGFEGRAACNPGTPLKIIFSLLSRPYALGARGRRALYQWGWLQVKCLPAPVVSVGNLTVGGTGKTPLVACLARMFQEQGKKVAVLSRGYGGRAKGVTCLSDGREIYHQPPEVGEEAFWLARTLPGVMVYTAPSRYEAGMVAWRQQRPDIFLLDDGFQHFQLHRDLDLVLLDAEAPFGNGLLLPAGPLREPAATLAAAQVLILTRFAPERHRPVLEAIKKAWPDKTVLTAAIAPTTARRFPAGEAHPLEALGGLPLFAFAGLARPQVFAQTLAQMGVGLKGQHYFPDHYDYTPTDLQALIREAQSQGATALITTSKDWARLGERWPGELPLWVLEVEAKLLQPLPDSIMDHLLARSTGETPVPPAFPLSRQPPLLTPSRGLGGEFEGRAGEP